MISRLFNRIAASLSFRQQLAIAFSLGIIILALVTDMVIAIITHQRLHNQLVEQGQTVADNFVEQSRLPLLFLSEESAQEASQNLLSFPNVVGVTILTANNEVLFRTGEFTPAETTSSANNTGSRDVEVENAWIFYRPVFAGEEITDEDNILFSEEPTEKEFIGSVQVKLSKQSLTDTTRELLQSASFATAIAAAVLLLILLTITNHLTKPIQHLSSIMKRAQEGDNSVRANLNGSKDVLHMEQAFNKMMSELEIREEELRRARDTALASARIKGQFATTVSHELRTPMNGVMGMLELLHSMELNEEQLEYVNIARSSGEELLLLIDDILDFSKIESGKLKLHKSAFDPREMVKSITELLASQAQQKQLEINCDIQDDIPNLLIGDTGRIRQIMINLIGNAIKFTHQGNITIRISKENIENSNKSNICYSIEDTGIGIEEDAQQRIFEAFSQADGSTTRQFGGTGLGLAICSQLVELMGGTIGVDSEVGRGSKFWISLPFEFGDESEKLESNTAIELAGLRVLIVSRTPESRHSLINNFIQWQCYQRNATSADEALSILKQNHIQGKPFDFLLIDTPLEDHTEKDLIKNVSESDELSDINIILLTHANLQDLPTTARCLKKNPGTDLLQSTLLSMISKNTLTEDNEKISDAYHILIVEDNVTNQVVAQSMVQKLGYTCSIADNGSDALDQLAHEKFDLVLMDCQMPEMNGFTATQIIRSKESNFQHIPVIALTATNSTEDINRCFTSGMSDYLNKPITLESLAPKIEHWANTGKRHLSVEKVKSIVGASNESPGISIRHDTINRDTLSALRTQIEGSFVKIVEAYVNDTPVYVRNLTTALRNQNTTDIKYFAHLIKGSSSNLGATKLASYCQSVENICLTGRFENTEKIILDISQEFKEVESILVREANRELEGSGQELSFQPHILVTDDDQSSRMVMRGILEKIGYRVSEASSGMEAIKICEDQVPDLVLMDALMPGMDGFTACEKIVSLGIERSPSILMITALQDEGTLDRAFAAGATDFILKPINMTVLQQRVSRALHTEHFDRHIHQLSYYDNLTSLPNRTFFIERSKNLLNNAKLHHSKVAVIFLDLDRFKLVNDSQGHESGDMLLKTFSKRLEGCVRSADLVARLGGDEFTVVLNNISAKEDAAKVATKILNILREPFEFHGQHIYLSSSIGIAFFPTNGDTISELMKQADTAMFQAKSKGGNCYAFYEPGMERDVTRQIELEIEIREALEHDQFTLHYQPQVDLKTGNLIGLEALIRWEHPKKGMVPPFEFIPWAEKCGLITSIGDWVINRACAQLREWLNQGISPVPIAVNVSGGELADSVLYKKVADALKRNDIPPELLKLEITEDTLAGGDDLTTQHLNDLRNLGTTLAIDDFGTGYSSLSYLKMFPVDTLKIDRSFVKDLPEDSNGAAIIAGIIALGHSLNLKIVAEGVETQEQREFLKKEGCDIIQGYLLSKPLPTHELEEWILQEQKQGGHHWQLASSTKAPRRTQPPL